MSPATAAEEGDPQFELRGASVIYAKHAALTEVDLKIRRGEAVALIGPSGAGKTTLLRLLGAALRTTGGAALVEGRDLARLNGSSLRALRSSLGSIPQDLGLVPNLRVLTNVLAGAVGQQSLFATLRTLIHPARANVLTVHELLERVGIGEKLYQRLNTLSGGEQQRVALARALFATPVALLADEPVASVDPLRARDVLELLRAVARERGTTLVVSLHQLELARACFPRLIGLREGRVFFDRPSEDVSEAEWTELYRLEERAPDA